MKRIMKTVLLGLICLLFVLPISCRKAQTLNTGYGNFTVMNVYSI